MQLLARKFTVEQYYKMADVGILTEQEKAIEPYKLLASFKMYLF